MNPMILHMRASFAFCDGWCGPVLHGGEEHVLLPGSSMTARYVVPASPDHVDFTHGYAPLLVSPNRLIVDMGRAEVRSRFDQLFKLVAPRVSTSAKKQGLAFISALPSGGMGYFSDEQTARAFGGIYTPGMAVLLVGVPLALVLPDGSRVVDALARRAIGEQTWGAGHETINLPEEST